MLHKYVARCAKHGRLDRPTLGPKLALSRPSSPLEIMCKFPYFALTRLNSHYLEQTRLLSPLPSGYQYSMGAIHLTKLQTGPTGKSAPPERWTRGAYHLAKKSGNFGLKSNGKVIFRKFRSEIVEYLQRYSSFSVRNGTAEISLPFAKVSSFQSPISRKQLREIELQMVSAISFGWFADFGKTLTIIQRSSQPVYSDKW